MFVETLFPFLRIIDLGVIGIWDFKLKSSIEVISSSKQLNSELLSLQQWMKYCHITIHKESLCQSFSDSLKTVRSCDPEDHPISQMS